MDEKNQAINAIKKKLVGKELNYKEIYTIMDQISQQKLGDILTTYFAASGFSKGFSDDEIYHLTKAMVETGEKLHFPGIVADKHSIGGVPGTRTTLIVIPIVAAAGYTIPKSSSRAITTPGGTADDMELIAPVNLTKAKILSVVEKTGGCIVWGGSFKIAPADDVIIKVEEALLFESYDKILISIMAKKVAFGSNHVVIDIPYGKSVKVHNLKDAESLKKKFVNLAHKFNIKIDVLIHKTEEPAGRGVGPLLEVKESLMVLEQDENRALDLEARSINLAGSLLELCLADSPVTKQKEIRDKYKNGYNWAKDILSSGLALNKMHQIIEAQGGKKNVTSQSLVPGKHSYIYTSPKDCVIESFDVKHITMIARLLGAPNQKKSGMYLNKKIGEKIKKGDPIVTFYSESVYNLKEAKDSLKNFPLMTFK